MKEIAHRTHGLNRFGTDYLCELCACLCVLCGFFLLYHKGQKAFSQSTKRRYLTLVLALPKHPSPYQRRGTSHSDRVRLNTNHLCELCACLCVLCDFFLLYHKGRKAFSQSTQRRYLTLVLALPKHPSPCQRRGTSHSDRVRSNT